MKRTTDTDRVINKHGVGRDGFADEVVDGDEIVVPGTIVDDSWLDSVQEEIARAIELLGGTLNAANMQQLGELLLSVFSVVLGSGTVLPRSLIVVPYLVATAAYSGFRGSLSQGNATECIAFSADGTKMYAVEDSNNTVYQYTLSTAWSVSTASYSGISLSVAAQDTNPGGIAFSADGTKMYIVGSSADTIFQYTLPTPWSLTGASYSGLNLSVAAQDLIPQSLAISSDGAKMYMLGSTGDAVYQYTLPTPWSLTGASYSGTSFSVAGQDLIPTSIAFSSDGFKFWIFGATNNNVYEYRMSTAWSLATAAYNNVSFSPVAQISSSSGIAFSADGTKMYLVSPVGTQFVYQYYTSRVAVA
jgi:hypothetical protein